jgi:hypothetical protein
MYERDYILSTSGTMESPATLRDKGVKNIGSPLPIAPRVKRKDNGRILDWHPMFARRPEAFVCCDEYGNEDPATWWMRGPDGNPVNPEPYAQYAAPVSVPRHPVVRQPEAPVPPRPRVMADIAPQPIAPAPSAPSAPMFFVPPQI